MILSSFTTFLKILPGERAPSLLACPETHPSQLEASFSMALQIFDAAPVEQSWHISRISWGQGKHWVMQGCTFLLPPRCTRNKGHGCGKSTRKSPSNSSMSLHFPELVGTQAQAKAVLRLFLFKSHISKEKCFNPLHLIEGQGWSSAGKHDLSYLSLFLTARALPSGSWLEAITGSSCSVRLSVWIP